TPVKPVPRYSVLRPNYPNPFNASTVITYTLAVDAEIALEVYNVLGKRVSVLAKGFRRAGTYTATFNAPENLPSGAYFCRVLISSVARPGRIPGSATMKMLY